MKKLYLLFFAFFLAGSVETCFASDKEDMSDDEVNEFKSQSKVVRENNRISSDFMENNQSVQEFNVFMTNNGSVQIPSNINVDDFFDEDDSSDDWLTKDNPFNEENKKVELEKAKEFTIGKTSTPKKNSNRNRRTNNFNNKRNCKNPNKKSNN